MSSIDSLAQSNVLKIELLSISSCVNLYSYASCLGKTMQYEMIIVQDIFGSFFFLLSDKCGMKCRLVLNVYFVLRFVVVFSEQGEE